MEEVKTQKESPSKGVLGERHKQIKVLRKQYDMLKSKTADILTSNETLTPPEVDVRPSGFYNMGNTCFLNSALQCLMHTLPMRTYSLCQAHTKKCKVKDYCAFCSLEKLMVEYYGHGMKNKREALKP